MPGDAKPFVSVVFLLVCDTPFHFILFYFIFAVDNPHDNKGPLLQSTGVVIPAFVVIFCLLSFSSFRLTCTCSPLTSLRRSPSSHPAHHSTLSILPFAFLLCLHTISLDYIVPAPHTNYSFLLSSHITTRSNCVQSILQHEILVDHSLLDVHGLRRCSSPEHCRSRCCRRSIVPCMSGEDRYCKPTMDLADRFKIE